MPDLRDPIWQSIGVILALVAIFVTVLIALFQRSRKSLSSSIMSTSPLYTLHPESKERLRVLFDGKEIKNANLVLIRIMNSGNAPILPTDYEKPISIDFSKNVTVLSSELIESIPKKLSLAPINRNTAVEIPPILLNPNEGFTLKILIDNFDNSIQIVSRIAGVRHIPIRKEGKKEFFVTAMTGFALSFFGQFLYDIESIDWLRLVASIFVIVGPFLVLFATLRSRTSWWYWIQK